MKINTITEFKSFINDLNLDYGYTKDFLYNIFAYKDQDFYILDIEKRKVIQTSQTFSLDSEWVSHIDETTLFELFIETLKIHFTDTMVLTLNTLEDLKKVEQFIKTILCFWKGDKKKWVDMNVRILTVMSLKKIC